MALYPPNPNRRPFPPRYRQGFGPPNQIRQVQPFSYPNYQPQASRFGRLSDNLNTIMGHAGSITNGVNMLRQVGAFLSMLR